MKIKNVLFCIFALFVFSSCKSANAANIDKSCWNTNYTYVFVHGLWGWGHYESYNTILPYWGMKNGSLIEQLKKYGIDCADASVAPQGSAWDRACELYAQLTGTVVDYGAEHSARCGHERFGRDFSADPLIKNWDSGHKVNLFGHSFGGVTIRLLAHLMENGSQAEIDATPADELSPLFAGGHGDWIYSVTTIAAPHNGTSAFHILDENLQDKAFMQKIWDKSIGKNDSRADYDYAGFDMHIQNAAKINSWLKTVPQTYYFSFACSATSLTEEGTQAPNILEIEDFYFPTATIIGKFEGTTSDGIVLDKKWQENDGLVNTVSAMAPDFAPKNDYSQNEKIEKGIWNVMPVYHGDHMSLQGGMAIETSILEFYLEHINRINSL